MCEYSKEIHSSCNFNVIPHFQDLQQALNCNNFESDKSATWRQQSLLIKNFNGGLKNDLKQRHWLHYNFRVDSNHELHTNYNFMFNDNLGKHIEFPNKEVNLPSNCRNNENIFKDNHAHIADIKMPSVQNNNKNLGALAKSRNTIEHFLHGKNTSDHSSSFCSARQLLAVQTSKKHLQTDATTNQTNIFTNNSMKPDVGFNFSATKKSLGSLGRLVNTSRKNFVSPVRSKSITSDKNTGNEDIIDSGIASLLSHPALQNIEPKMVELINNEIIHTFKSVDWKEIAGLEYAKSIIKEAVVYPLLRPDIFTGLRRPPRGILLFGPPGTGKTLIGKCIASQSSSTFFSISSSSLTSKWMGEGEKMVRALFAVAVARQPSVIFIDEIDSLLSQRSENENEGTRRLKTEFLVRLDGAATSDDDRVLIVGATNRPQELDEAVRRRFVKRLYVPLPDTDARAEILTNLLKTVDNNLNANDVKQISQLANGYSGADMDSLCREASMEPLRSLSADTILTFHKDNLRPVNINDFYSALKKIRPSVSQSDLNQYVEWNKKYGSSY